MKFPEFVATRQRTDDISQFTTDEAHVGLSGYIYLDVLCIEFGPQPHFDDREYSLQLGNHIWTEKGGSGLGELERRLYDWAVSEGYSDTAPDIDWLQSTNLERRPASFGGLPAGFFIPGNEEAGGIVAIINDDGSLSPSFGTPLTKESIRKLCKDRGFELEEKGDLA